MPPLDPPRGPEREPAAAPEPAAADPGAVDDATLVRYLTGSATAAEAARVERWAQAHPTHRRTLDALRAAWHPAPAALDAEAEDTAWQSLAARLNETPDAAPGVPNDSGAGPPSRRLPAARGAAWTRLGRAAAALLVVAAGASVAARWGRGRGADAAVTTAAARPDATWRAYATRRGQRATVGLADGSRVLLAPGSRLRVAPAFGARGAARTVHLDGQALFTVRHDPARPFAVHTAHGVAEDLGTTFVVASYAETRATRVVVAEGAVALRDARAARPRFHLRLGPGDLARVDAAGAVAARRNVNVDAHLAWTRGGPAFDGVAVVDALPELARRYDLDLRLPPGAAGQRLGERRLTAAFRDEPAARVLRVLELTLDVRAERAGSAVTLVPHDPAAPGPLGRRPR